MGVRMVMAVLGWVSVMVVLVFMILGHVNIELDALDASLLPAPDVQMIAFQAQLAQLAFQLAGLDAQIQQGTDEHIAADSADQVQIQSSHF